MYAVAGKRSIDIAISTAIAVVATPVAAAVAVLIRVEDGPPVFFRQTRAGLNGEAFTILKFRTMRSPTAGTSREDRVTTLGRSLRKFSLDEIPQLINVIRGDMSLVGPRPLPMRYNERYSDRQRRRLLVRPGITGLAQVSGRNDLSWDQRFELDIDYVTGSCFLLDAKIMFRTVKLLIRPGSSSGSTDPSIEFSGSVVEIDGRN